MEFIRVVVIDDSAFMRKMISDILNSDPRIEVIGTARNGKLGIEKVKKLRPDVVTIDINMPVMDGVTALKKIMENHPVPVIVLSANATDEAAEIIQLIESGAVNIVEKPSGPISLNIESIKEEIISKVITASKADVTTFSPKKLSINETTIRKQNSLKQSKFDKPTFVAIGTSTGGPGALQRLLTDLPEDFKSPILIVQHMPKGFTKSLAERLNTLSNLHVKEATHGELVQEGTVYIAPGNFHMRVKRTGRVHVIHIEQGVPVHSHRPSIDVLFESISELDRIHKIAVILTGMGSDGSRGIKTMKEKDPSVLVIGEAEETSVIYGMPKAAFETGEVDYILPICKIGAMLSELTR